MGSQLFPGSDRVTVIFSRFCEPERAASWARLFEQQRAALERELGGPFDVALEPRDGDAVWNIGPGAYQGPTLVLDRTRSQLTSGGRNMDEVEETFSHLRSLHRQGDGTWIIEECKTVDEAVARIETEVATSYPSFALRGISWVGVCSRFRPLVAAAVDPIAAMQEWLAALHDGHTWVRPVPPHGELPYSLRVEEGVATFIDVPAGTAGFARGVRPGHVLVNEDVVGWWRRTAATAHSKPYLVGRRLLASPVGSERTLSARGADGQVIVWTETIPPLTWDPVISWSKLASGNGYLRIRAWIVGQGLQERIDEAFDALHGCKALIVDLRGNPGGNLVMAQQFRDRFLRSGGTLGWIQGTYPDGGLAEKTPIVGDPAPTHQRWAGDVRFLTDPSTYSASEDVILGLQGLDHVKVIGEPSGGGSGRIRLIRLLPGWRLTISTALTFDRNGRCIEGHGIPVDVPVASSAALAVADNLCEP